MDAQCARGTLGRVTRREDSDVQVAAGVHGRGLAFEPWLLAGETYLHVPNVRCSTEARARRGKEL